MRALILASLVAAACSIPEKHASQGAIDAPAGTPDAPPGTPDGPTFDAGPAYACRGQTPTTAPATITLSGIVQDPFTGMVSVGATVGLYAPGGTTPITTATTDGSGNFSETVPTGGAPLQGYGKVTKAGLVDTYVYNAAPLTANVTTAVFQFDGNEYMNLGSGAVWGFAIDCTGKPFEGATVSSVPSGAVSYFKNGAQTMTGATDASGVFLIMGLPVGNVSVTGIAPDGGTLRMVTFPVIAGSVAQIAIEP